MGCLPHVPKYALSLSIRECQRPDKFWSEETINETAPIAGPRPNSSCRGGGENRWRHLHPRHGAGKADGRRSRRRRPRRARRGLGIALIVGFLIGLTIGRGPALRLRCLILSS